MTNPYDSSLKPSLGLKYLFCALIQGFQILGLATCVLFVFVLFEWTPSQRKEVGIPLGILPHVREQNKRSYFPRPGQSLNPNTAAAGDQTQRLA